MAGSLNRRQAGLYYSRRNRLARVVLGNLTAWAEGLSVTAGQYVQSAGNGYLAVSSGTTGASAPTQTGGSANHSDGGVTWQYVDPQIFGNFVYTAPGTPA
jgi:hypothetical protein